ncbi:hypothetical protein TRIUR3_14962 [Triticum urartu]|uniref:Uncharacterized protein n=1 Tax=Triticum urartu TaxID=4572 RepID=M8AS13_TRIUA|nr:hypothetical protein TRIUR3_14962 [Triticum urartu]
MADATPTKPSKKGSSEPAVLYDGAKAKTKSKAVVHADTEDGHAGDAASPAPAHRTRLLRGSHSDGRLPITVQTDTVSDLEVSVGDVFMSNM